MMAGQMEVLLLEKCGSYAYSDSIASDPSTAKVVILWELERVLSAAYPAAYQKVMQNHHSLEDFLKYTGRDIVRSGAIWREWNYEVMTWQNYMNDKRHDHNCFSKLIRLPKTANAPLMVFYLKEEKRRYEAERALSKRGNQVPKPTIPTLQAKQSSQNGEVRDSGKSSSNSVPNSKRTKDLSQEIDSLCQSLSPTQKIMDDVKNVKNRIQVMLNQVWPGRNYQVVLFGSSSNTLALKDADVDLCILVPNDVYEQDLLRYRQRIAKQPKSVHNMFFLASRLREMGMVDVEAIGGAQVPICKFVDPQTGYHCDINTNNVLGIENSNLIKEYCSLDTRIRPLIFAVKYFVKQKNINNPRGGTLSSYAYVIMILHFLMNVLQRPVIPSLQEPVQKCPIRNCYFNYNKITSLLQDNQIFRWSSRYHDCLYIDNVNTKKFLPQYRNTGTRWEGYNKDNVGQLLRSFFRYFSKKDNFHFSIIAAGGAIQQNHNIQSVNCPFIIQDPFIRTKNIARSCTDAGAKVIISEFERAAKMLADGGHTFKDVCESPSNIPRPVDTQSMEYRFQHKVVKVPQQKQNDGRQVETIRRVDKEVVVLENEVKQLEKSSGLFDNSDIEEFFFNEPVYDDDPPMTSGYMELITDNQASKSSSGPKINLDSYNTSSNSSASTSQISTDVKPILNLVETLMKLKPHIGENTPVESYTSKPCTDMSKLLGSSAVKDVSAKDVCYLISQLNFLGDALAEKLTNSSKPMTAGSQLQQFSFDENDYIKELQDMVDGVGLEDGVANYYIDEDEEDDDDEYDEDDEDDEEELMIIRPGKSKNAKYNANDIVTIEYYVSDPPGRYLDEYLLQSTLQWYGKVRDVLHLTDVFHVWRITMDIRYGNLKVLPAKLDVGHDRLKAYAAIID